MHKLSLTRVDAMYECTHTLQALFVIEKETVYFSFLFGMESSESEAQREEIPDNTLALFTHVLIAFKILNNVGLP